MIKNKLQNRGVKEKAPDIEIKYVNSIVLSSKTLLAICSIFDIEALINPRIAKIANELHQIGLERQAYEMQIKSSNK
jgi:hypothetical protein